MVIKVLLLIPEQLALTDQLFDAALGRVEGCCVRPALPYWLVISTWSPPKSLAWQKGFRLGSGLILRVLGRWLLVSSLLLPVSVSGVLLVVLVVILWLVCPLLAAAVLSCAVQLDRWIAPHLAVRCLL